MTQKDDLGAPVAYLVLADGAPAYDKSYARIGHVVHVIADEREDVFHGLLLKTDAGHRFASADQVDGIFEHGVVIAVPAAELLEPSEDGPADLVDEPVKKSLKQAWDWLVQPK